MKKAREVRSVRRAVASAARGLGGDEGRQCGGDTRGQSDAGMLAPLRGERPVGETPRVDTRCGRRMMPSGATGDAVATGPFVHTYPAGPRDKPGHNLRRRAFDSGIPTVCVCSSSTANFRSIETRSHGLAYP